MPNDMGRRAATRRVTTPLPDSAAATEEAPPRIVLVLQGGGALGSYQLGVFEALEQAGLRPDWIVGTSIGALNGAIIAGNAPERRLERLSAFWQGLARPALLARWGGPWGGPWGGMELPFETVWRRMEALWLGVPGLYRPLGGPLGGMGGPALYDPGPLRAHLAGLVEEARLNEGAPRLTVGAVSVATGRMRYFDSRDERLTLDHVLASAALPPAFPPVEIKGEPFWDGGLCSNTPIEAVFADRQRRSAVIVAVQLWQPEGPAPGGVWETMGRMRDIQFASRAATNIAHQAELHHLRHVVRELEKRLPEALAGDPEVKELTAWGCGTRMHVLHLVARPMPDEAHLKELDFGLDRLWARRAAGLEAATRMLQRAPWREWPDARAGVLVHEEGE